jgi:hypothetical protein
MEICKFCEYWKASSEEDPTAGICRRFPPIVVATIEEKNPGYGDEPYNVYDVESKWPATDWDDSCGEFGESHNQDQEEGFFDDNDEPDDEGVLA